MRARRVDALRRTAALRVVAGFVAACLAPAPAAVRAQAKAQAPAVAPAPASAPAPATTPPAGPAGAQPASAVQPLDAAHSRVSIQFRQMGVPVEADFRKFGAQVAFDPARPAEARATVEIDTASFDLGEDEYNEEVRKKEWFDSSRFPKATFVASGARPVGPGRFEVPGKLTIKGRTLDVVTSVTVRTEGRMQIFEGQVPVKRLAFGIGEGEWKDTSTVADEVIVRFRLATIR